MNDEELRTWVARQLKRDDLPDPLWEYMKQYEEDALEHALLRGAEERKELLKVVRRLLKLSKEVEDFESSGQRSREAVEVTEVETQPGTSYEKERSEAFSEYLALVGGADEGVQRFRRKVLGWELLEARQAYHFVSSPAAARYPLAWFKHWKIPVVDHKWTIEGECWGVDDHGLYVITTFTVDPPNITRRVKKHKDYDLFWGPTKLISGWEKQRARREQYEDDEKHYSYGELETLKFFFRETTLLTNEISVFPGSVLDELRKLSQELTEELCYPWKQEEAAWFVLTDEAPKVRAIDAKFIQRDNYALNYGTIDLSVEPWVTAETVFQTYRDVQRQVLGHGSRRISSRNIAVFTFLTARLRSRIRKQLWQGEDVGVDSWRRRVDEWNELHPEGDKWHYKNNSDDKAVRHFQRDFSRRALPAIVRPSYTPPRNDE